MRRTARVAGLEGIDHAVTATKVVQDAGVPVSLWMGGVGTVPGSVAWSVPVESIAQWASYSDTLLGDEAYRRVAAEGQSLIEEFGDDRLMRIVHGEIDRPTEVGEYLSSIEAVVHPDRAAPAATFAPEVADAWSALTGLSAIVVTNAAGPMGTISWYARHPDAASIDAAEEAVAASADYAEMLAKGDGLFTSGVQTFARRIA